MTMKLKRVIATGLISVSILGCGYGVAHADANTNSSSATSTSVKKTSNDKKSKSASNNDNKSKVKKTTHKKHVKKGFQNPRSYYQVINNTNDLKVNKMPSIGQGWEGTRTYAFTHRFGLPDGHNYFTSADANYVRNFQKRHHLKITGRLDYETWRKMGFSKWSWNNYDDSIANHKYGEGASRQERINYGLSYVKRFLGGPWTTGTSSYAYGKHGLTDCSGLAIQYLAAAGLKSPWTPLRHSEPGNEYDSTKMWGDSRLKRVDFKNRQRGDLIFFAASARSSVWHVGIMVSKDTMIDNWPPVCQYHSIYNGEHGVIIGVKRPFI